MKRLLLPILASTMLICTLAGCSNNNASSSSSSSATSSPSSSQTESSSTSTAASSSSTAESTSSSEVNSPQNNPSNPEEAVRAAVDEEYKNVFGYDTYSDSINEDPEVKKSFEAANIDIDDYARTAEGLYSYEIKNVVIEGDHAIVTLLFNGRDLSSSFNETLKNKIIEFAGPDNPDTLPKEEVVKLETRALYSIMKNNEIPPISREIIQYYVNDPNEGWTIDEKHEGCVPFIDLMY